MTLNPTPDLNSIMGMGGTSAAHTGGLSLAPDTNSIADQVMKAESSMAQNKDLFDKYSSEIYNALADNSGQAFKKMTDEMKNVLGYTIAELQMQLSTSAENASRVLRETISNDEMIQTLISQGASHEQLGHAMRSNSIMSPNMNTAANQVMQGAAYDPNLAQSYNTSQLVGGMDPNQPSAIQQGISATINNHLSQYGQKMWDTNTGRIAGQVEQAAGKTAGGLTRAGLARMGAMGSVGAIGGVVLGAGYGALELNEMMVDHYNEMNDMYHEGSLLGMDRDTTLDTTRSIDAMGGLGHSTKSQLTELRDTIAELGKGASFTNAALAAGAVAMNSFGLSTSQASQLMSSAATGGMTPFQALESAQQAKYVGQSSGYSSQFMNNMMLTGMNQAATLGYGGADEYAMMLPGVFDRKGIRGIAGVENLQQSLLSQSYDPSAFRIMAGQAGVNPNEVGSPEERLQVATSAVNNALQRMSGLDGTNFDTAVQRDSLLSRLGMTPGQARAILKTGGLDYQSGLSNYDKAKEKATHASSWDDVHALNEKEKGFQTIKAELESYDFGLSDDSNQRSQRIRRRIESLKARFPKGVPPQLKAMAMNANVSDKEWDSLVIKTTHGNIDLQHDINKQIFGSDIHTYDVSASDKLGKGLDDDEITGFKYKGEYVSADAILGSKSYDGSNPDAKVSGAFDSLFGKGDRNKKKLKAGDVVITLDPDAAELFSVYTAKGSDANKFETGH